MSNQTGQPKIEWPDPTALDVRHLCQIIEIAMLQYRHRLICCECGSRMVSEPIGATELQKTIHDAIKALDAGRAEQIRLMRQEIFDLRRTRVQPLFIERKS